MHVLVTFQCQGKWYAANIISECYVAHSSFYQGVAIMHTGLLQLKQLS